MRAAREEYDAAAKVAADFFEAVAKKDRSICKDCFLPGAVLYGATDGKLNVGTYENLLNQVDNSLAGPEFNYRVDVIAIDHRSRTGA